MVELIAGSRKAHVLILCCVIIAVFANSLENPLVWDDILLIQKNPWISSVDNIPDFFLPEYWEEYHPIRSTPQYRPVRVSSLALDYALWKDNPIGFRLTNMLLHLASTLLLYLAVAGLVRGQGKENDLKNFLIPFVTALLFAVHPIHSEAINLVKNRSELLALFFVLASLVFFMKGKDKKGLRYLFGWACTLGCFFLALASKETALVFPFLALLYLWVFHRNEGLTSHVFHTLPLFLLLAGFAAFRILLFDSPDAEEAISLGLAAHVVLIIKTVGAYIWMLAFPLSLTVERVMPPHIYSPQVLGGISILAGALVYGYKARKNSPFFVFALGWFIITLAPASNLHYLDARPLAEQRLYMPSAGFCLILGLAFCSLITSEIKARKTLAAGLAGLLALAYGGASISQNHLWGDPIELWTRAVRFAPDNPRPHFNLGNAFLAQKMYAQAVSQFEMTLQMDEGNPDAINNLACALVSLDRVPEAIENIHKALKKDPNSEIAYYNLGNAMVKSNRLSEAVMYYELALGIKPDLAMAHCNLGYLLAKMGNTEKALDHLALALEIAPSDALIHHTLANILAMTGDLDQARIHYQKALELDPEESRINYEYGNLLSRMGDVEEASEQHRAALEKDPDDPRFHANMANTLSRQGRYAEAMTHYKKALELEPKNAMIQTNMGIALADQGKVDEAAVHFKAAIEDNPDFAPAYYNLGFVLAKQGDHQLAYEQFRRAVEIKPDYSQAFYEIGNSLTHLGHFEKAVKSYVKALETDPDNPRIHHNLGIVYARTNRLELAVQSFEKALALKPDYHEAQKNLEQAKQLLGAQ
ncbi:MAG: tetratricopeptide repeat protein [Desulfatibacillum sp.]|nr:tetratricopeptide repeat protein [Desulfatibacillum sp.]